MNDCKTCEIHSNKNILRNVIGVMLSCGPCWWLKDMLEKKKNRRIKTSLSKTNTCIVLLPPW